MLVTVAPAAEINVISGEEEPESHDGKENQECPHPHRVIEMRLRAFGLGGRDICRGNGRHRNASPACQRRLGAVDDRRVTKARAGRFRKLRERWHRGSQGEMDQRGGTLGYPCSYPKDFTIAVCDKVFVRNSLI
jgi:hypothetical protein